MSNIDYHYETIGRILSHLVNQGLRRISIESKDAMGIMTHRVGSEQDVQATFNDVLRWMLAEGLIRATSAKETINGYLYLTRVQLTSKGIAIIQTKTNDPDIGESIEKTVTEAQAGGLDATAYTKIGSFVGGVVGGFTKSISG